MSQNTEANPPFLWRMNGTETDDESSNSNE